MGSVSGNPMGFYRIESPGKFFMIPVKNELIQTF